jgi:hypothetical protein
LLPLIAGGSENTQLLSHTNPNPVKVPVGAGVLVSAMLEKE